MVHTPTKSFSATLGAILALALFFGPVSMSGQSVTLLWDASTSPGATGYLVYYGTDGTNFDSQMDAGSNTFATVNGLQPGTTNYFEVVAYNAYDLVSPPSNLIQYDVAPMTQTLILLANPVNAGSLAGGGTFVQGSSVTVVATASSGYTFIGWTENGIVQSTSANYTFTLTANVTLTAIFTANPITYTVATPVNPDNAGNVAGSGTFTAGSTVTVTATPSSGYAFINWTENGIVQSSSPSYSFILANNRNLIANFSSTINYTVATQINPANEGNVTGGGPFAAGSFVTVTAIANNGYAFTNWTENGVIQSTSPSYTFALATNRNLVANFASAVTYTVATQVSPIDDGTVTGAGIFSLGSSVSVTATPNAGYAFTNWTENGIVQSTSTTYTFALATNRNLVANFAASTVIYTLALQLNPANAGLATGAGNYITGSSVTVAEIPGSGYAFTNWMENGIVLSTSPNYAITLTTNHNLVANFVSTIPVNLATLVNPANAGIVTGGGTFPKGSSVTVTATPNYGYTFTNWTANGIVQSASPTYTFTLASNQSLTANFAPIPVTYTVAAQINPANAGIVTGGGTFNTGSSVTVTAIASSGYIFTNWTENGLVQSSLSTYVFTLATNRYLTANFVVNPTYMVATQINPANAGNVTGGGLFVAGSGVAVTATPNNGYTFTNWTENGIVQATSSAYTFMLATNRNLTANFAATPISYTVNPISGVNGNIIPSASQTVVTGGSITFTASPVTSYKVDHWMVNGVAVQNGGSAFTLQNITGNSSVAVFFASATPNNTNFALVVNGNGTLSPKPNIKLFQQGRRYFLSAVPAKGYLFADWTSNGVVVSTATRYGFMVESNVVLQANFVVNPFLPVAGGYHGLFYVADNPAENSSGSFVANVTSAGLYSASARLGASSYSFSGEFSLTGVASKSISRPGLSPLTVAIQLDLSNGPMTGTVSDGTWTAELEADPAVYSNAHPAPQAGKYTLLFPGSENASAQPGGNGFGTMTVNAAGLVSFSGSLGDGTPVISSSTVSSQGQWPFYVSLYGGQGSILGWLAFTNNGDIGGQISWFKLPKKAAKIYPGGFTNSTAAMGSVYKYTNGYPVLGFTDGLLSLINGDLAEGITNQVGLGPEILAVDQSATKLTYTTSSGLFKGSVMNPETGKLISVDGIVLQNQNLAAGYFLGTNESGSVVVSPTQ